VRGVEDDRIPELAHVREPAHVDDEVVIAERRPRSVNKMDSFALRQELVDHVLHVSRGDELALLDVHGLAGGRRARSRSVWRHRKRGDLEHVQHVGGRIDLRDLMDVGEHRHAQRVAHLLQDAESFDETGPTVAVDRRAVALS